MKLNCFKCGVPTRRIFPAKELLGNCLVTDAEVYMCDKCGEEYTEGEEYERVRKKIATLESKTTSAAAGQPVVII